MSPAFRFIVLALVAAVTARCTGSVAGDPGHARDFEFTPTSLVASGTSVLQASPPVVFAPAGGEATLTLEWDARPAAEDLVVFVHFVDDAGTIAFADDYLPSQGTSVWSGRVSHRRTVAIPASARGSYAVLVGLYQGHAPWDRLPLDVGPGVVGDSELRYRVATFTVGEAPSERPGPIVGDTSGLCVGTMGDPPSPLGAPRVVSADCDGSPNQVWSLRGTTLMASDGTCVDVPSNAQFDGAELQTWECNGTSAQDWRWRDGNIVSSEGLCVTGSPGSSPRATIVLRPCSPATPHQVWRFDGSVALPPTPAEPGDGAYASEGAPAAVLQWIRVADGGAPARVPDDFLGMHFNHYPIADSWIGEPSPAPAFGYGAWRSHGSTEMSAWRSIDRGYNAGEYADEARDWSHPDHTIPFFADSGRSVMWTIWGTPTGLATSTNGNALFPNWPGANYAPKDSAMAKVRKFAADLVARYPNRLKWVEASNEPDPENPIPDERNFYVGSRASLAEFTRMVREGVRQSSRDVSVAGPAIVMWGIGDDPSTPIPYFQSVLTASDYTGATRLVDHLDVVSFHYYNRESSDPMYYWVYVKKIENTLAAIGAARPLINSETGIIDNTTWDAASIDRLSSNILRQALIGAAMGVKGHYLYQGDGPNLASPTSPGSPTSEVIDRLYRDLKGFTIYEAAQLADRSIWASGLKNGVRFSVRYFKSDFGEY